MEQIVLSYNSENNTGIFYNQSDNISTGWKRIVSAAINLELNSAVFSNKIILSWHQALSIIREFIPLQRQFGFKFITDDSSQRLVHKFMSEQKLTRQSKESLSATLTSPQIVSRLKKLGFLRRELKPFQIRDISRLISLPNGANFSVPGAGKTTVTLAVHLLTTNSSDKLLVICPKSAFTAWNEIIDLCIDREKGWQYSTDNFINLSGLGEQTIVNIFSSEKRFFYTNYEQFVSKRDVFAFLISTRNIHLVLDESHRMKAGELSQRGAALLSISNLPIRKDILSGTPMPQGASDLQSQLDFLWTGSSLGRRVQNGETPSAVISGLYTRTTKTELNIPPAFRHFIQVPMSSNQAALYGIVRNEVLRQLSSFKNGKGINIVNARKSVIRLLQLSSNPLLAVRSLSEDILFQDHPLINAIIEDPVSTKIQETCRLARLNASENKKTVIWTIFTGNIIDLERLLADLNPTSIYGKINSGNVEDEDTREGRLRRFHRDKNCMVLIANPAAAGEGISLHEACHEAIYLDRSYISTHYLQSVDRIHRLGLEPETITNITILQSAPPIGLGSIDYSVSRRLGRKIRMLQELLDDPDLHLLALDEESIDEPIDYSVDLDDVIDLIEELEGNKPYNSNDGM